MDAETSSVQVELSKLIAVEVVMTRFRGPWLVLPREAALVAA